MIQAPPFEDRVVHHALVSIIKPHLENKFIYDSYACRLNKGTHKATFRLQQFLRESKCNYVLKADIQKYFPSINNVILLDILRNSIKDKHVLWLCATILDTFGLQVGALTSQLGANVYLNELDHEIKDELSIPYYLRYMDDFIILGKNKDELWGYYTYIKKYLMENLHLTLNRKTDVFPVSKGIDFCGYRTWSTHILPRKKTLKRAKRKFKKMSDLYSQNIIDKDYVESRLNSFLGYVKHCDAWDSTTSVLSELKLTRSPTDSNTHKLIKFAA